MNAEINIFSLKSLLKLIFKTTNKRISVLAEKYILKDPSIIYKWQNNKVVPSNSDIVKIVEFVTKESTVAQLQILKEKILKMISDSPLSDDTKSVLTSIEDFNAFLNESLNISLTLNCRMANDAGIYKSTSSPSSSGEGLNNSIIQSIEITLPIRPARKFLGREKELAHLDSLLKVKNAVILVNGIGGIGKTELCRKYFWDNRESYDFAGWINYTSCLKKSFVNQVNLTGFKLCEGASIDDKYAEILRHICKLPPNSLLVIDNLAENPEDDITAILSLPVKVLITSREEFDCFVTFGIDTLDEQNCMDLFYSYFIGQRDDENLEKVINLVDNHTLTIELLARTASNSARSVEEILIILKKKGLNLGSEIKETVNTQWRISEKDKLLFEYLVRAFDMSSLSEVGRYILMNMSILPSVYISMHKLRQWLGIDTNNELNLLVKKGWLKQHGFSVYMHRVIKDVAHYKHCLEVNKYFNPVNTLSDKQDYGPKDNVSNNKIFLSLY